MNNKKKFVEYLKLSIYFSISILQLQQKQSLKHHFDFENFENVFESNFEFVDDTNNFDIIINNESNSNSNFDVDFNNNDLNDYFDTIRFLFVIVKINRHRNKKFVH